MTIKFEDYENMPDPPTKDELLDRMAVTYEAAESLIASLSETTLGTPLHDGGWSIKDHIAHLTTWEQGIVALLNLEDRFGTMGINSEEININDYDAINNAINRLHKNRPLADLLIDFRQTRQALLTVLENLTIEDLQKPYHHYQPQVKETYYQKPVMGWLAGNTYAHYAEHLKEIGRLFQEI